MKFLMKIIIFIEIYLFISIIINITIMQKISQTVIFSTKTLPNSSHHIKCQKTSSNVENLELPEMKLQLFFSSFPLIFGRNCYRMFHLHPCDRALVPDGDPWRKVKSPEKVAGTFSLHCDAIAKIVLYIGPQGRTTSGNICIVSEGKHRSRRLIAIHSAPYLIDPDARPRHRE